MFVRFRNGLINTSQVLTVDAEEGDKLAIVTFLDGSTREIAFEDDESLENIAKLFADAQLVKSF